MHEPNRTHLWVTSGGRVVGLHSLQGTGPSTVRCRVLAMRRRSQNKLLQGQGLKSLKNDGCWELRAPCTKAPLFGLPASWPCYLCILQEWLWCADARLPKLKPFLKNVCVMSPAQGNEPLGNHAQMQRKPKILKSWTVSFLLRFASVWICFPRQEAGEYTITAIC